MKLLQRPGASRADTLRCRAGQLRQKVSNQPGGFDGTLLASGQSESPPLRWRAFCAAGGHILARWRAV